MTKDTSLSLPPDQRRHTLKSELKASLRTPQDSDITEAYLFEKFFGDPTGREYWACWLTGEHEDLGSFVELLAAHNARANTEKRSPQDLIFAYINRAFDRPIYRAVIDAAKRGEAWLHGDISALCSGAFENNDFMRLALKSKIEVSRQEMVKWLFADPNYHGLVPETARLFIRESRDWNPPSGAAIKFPEVKFEDKKETLKPADKHLNSRKGGGGRPLSDIWFSAAGYLASYVTEHDYPKYQSELVKVLQIWWEAKLKDGEMPGRKFDQRAAERAVEAMYATAADLKASRGKKANKPGKT